MTADKKDTLLNLARNQDERIFIAHSLDQINTAINKNRGVLTHFLDPGQAALLRDLGHGYGEVRVLTWGGYQDAERQRAILIPEDNAWYQPDYQLSLLCVASTGHEQGLQHRDYLGALLGLGIDRERVGDIVLAEGCAAVFVTTENLSYISQNWIQVGHATVTVEERDPETFNYTPPRLEEKVVICASPRIDVLVSKAFNLARGDSATLVGQGKVFLNWRQQLNLSAQVSAGDTISCRGYGRFRVLEYGGPTKKGRERFLLGFPVAGN